MTDGREKENDKRAMNDVIKERKKESKIGKEIKMIWKRKKERKTHDRWQVKRKGGMNNK